MCPPKRSIAHQARVVAVREETAVKTWAVWFGHLHVATWLAARFGIAKDTYAPPYNSGRRSRGGGLQEKSGLCRLT